MADFETLIDTGDMIFFRSRTFGGKVQRLMTNSAFDHVGLALKYRKPNDNSKVKLFVLEATGINVRLIILTNCQGVDIFSWDTFVEHGYHLMYEEVALRHLYQVNGHFELRSEIWLKRLEEFIKTHKGKKYRLNPLDLFRSNTQ